MENNEKEIWLDWRGDKIEEGTYLVFEDDLVAEDEVELYVESQAVMYFENGECI